MNWQSFYDKIPYTYPLSPTNLVLWVFLSVILLLFMVGIISLFLKKSPLFAQPAELSLLGVILYQAAQITFYYLPGTPADQRLLINFPIAAISFIGAVFAKDKKILTGFLSGLITMGAIFIVSLAYAFVLVSYSGRPEFVVNSLIHYMAEPAGAALGYFWLILIYPIILFLITVSSALGTLIRASVDFQGSIRRSVMLTTVILLITGISLIAALNQISTQEKQQQVWDEAIKIDNFREQLINTNGEKIISVTFDVSIPSVSSGNIGVYAQNVIFQEAPTTRLLIDGTLSPGDFWDSKASSLESGIHRIEYQTILAPSSSNRSYKFNISLFVQKDQHLPKEIAKDYETKIYSD